MIKSPVVVIGEILLKVIVPAETLLLNVFQSVLERYPLVDVVACVMLIAGDVPPEDTTGEVPVTDVTAPDREA
jgi:hypothetical protein